MSSAPLSIDTWSQTQLDEDHMADDHAPMWRQMISHIQERDLSNRNVLDFGCNQGGFLRMLYQHLPFQYALGVDIAEGSLAVANRYRGNLPVEYGAPALLGRHENAFDIAFSHEVIYLLPDLEEHARQIARSLAPRGVYYAVTACYTEMPLWPRWKRSIEESTNLPVPEYAVNDYAAAFHRAGFSVAAQRFKMDGFLRIPEDKTYYPTVLDVLDHFNDQRIIFRFSRH